MGSVEKMFCPKCGHEQSFEGQKFCSGCGMDLQAVGSALGVGGQGSVPTMTREEGLKWSALIFISGACAMAPLAGVLNIDALAGVFAVLGFGGAVILFTYSMFFLPKKSARFSGTGQKSIPGERGLKRIADKISGSVKEKIGGPIHDTADQNQTRPISYVPPVGDWRDGDNQPPSVIDSTTKLLAREEEKNKDSDQ